MEDMKGLVLHRWTPMHPHPMYRSHTDKTILLVKIEDKYVPIAEHAVEMVYQVTFYTKAPFLIFNRFE